MQNKKAVNWQEQLQEKPCAGTIRYLVKTMDLFSVPHFPRCHKKLQKQLHSLPLLQELFIYIRITKVYSTSSILAQCFISIPPDNVRRKPLVF